ncbi:MAG: DUF4365 domain-containing protein [Acidobacteria bacterium]|nr:DUF4365 domain-containing protein [Acidobacteriota bacterium]
MSNEIGQRGEAIFFVLLTKSFGRPYPIFRPQFLGDKWPAVDFIVELIGSGDQTLYFFAQVKTTRDGYTKQKHRLKVQVSAEGIQKLASYPAPTYIFGIDEVKEEGFILSANGESLKRISSLPTTYPIHKINQDLLFDEVCQFWKGTQKKQISSKFFDPGWR